MPQKLVDGSCPLLDQNTCKLRCMPGVRHNAAPHCRLAGSPVGIVGDHLVCFDFDQKQPCQIPGSDAIGVVIDTSLCVLQELGAEWVLSGDAAEFLQEVVGTDIEAKGLRQVVDVF